MSSADLLRKTLLSSVAQVSQSIRGLFPLLVARLLGPAAVGMLAVGWGWTDLISKFGVWGADQASTIDTARRLARGRPDQARAVVHRAQAVAIGRSLLLAGLVTAACRILPLPGDPRIPEALAWLVWALPFVAAYRVANGASWGTGHLEHAIASKGLTESTVTILAFLALWMLGLDRRAALLAVVVGYAASAWVATRLAWGTLDQVATAGSRPGVGGGSLQQAWAGFRRTARWIGLSDLLYLANMRMDVLMLSAWAGLSATWAGLDIAVLGAYGLAVEIAFAAKKVRNLFEPIFVPLLTAQLEGVGRQETAGTATIQQWMFTAQLALAGTLMLGAPAILRLFGPYFVTAAPWLVLLVVANVLNGLLFAESSVHVVAPQVNARINAIGAGSNLLLNLALIPWIGPIGAAIATTTSYGLQSIARLRYLARNRVPVPYSVLRPVLLRAVACALGAGLPVWLVRPGSPRFAAAGAILYCLAYCLWSGAGRWHQLRALWSQVHHARGPGHPEIGDPDH